jgi:hypothetical protein
MDLAERFWAKVDVGEPDACWRWQANTYPNGYGQFAVRCRPRLAHRVSWELEHGVPVPNGLCVCHRCDNRSCVNPAHLFLGTQRDNVRDCIAKGRARRGPGFKGRSGERNYAAKLTQTQVDEIRSRYATGAVTQVELGRLYGVTFQSIHHIVRNKRWRHE